MKVIINREIWDKSGHYIAWENCPLTTAIKEQLKMEVMGVSMGEVKLSNGITYEVPWTAFEYRDFEEHLRENPEYFVTLSLTALE